MLGNKIHALVTFLVLVKTKWQLDCAIFHITVGMSIYSIGVKYINSVGIIMTEKCIK